MALSSISKKGLAISLIAIAPSMLDWQAANASETYTYSLLETRQASSIQM